MRRLLLLMFVAALAATSASAGLVPSYLGTYGEGVIGDPFGAPLGVACNAAGEFYVVDGGPSRIEKFSRLGTHLFGWGVSGNNPGEFQGPFGIAVAPSGDVYVVDTTRPRIERFSAAGTFIGEWGTFGSGDGAFYGPRNVAIDAVGNVYVTDTQNHRIQKFTADGTHLLTIGSQGTGDGEFSEPWGIAVDAIGDIYVADTWAHRIQKFDSDGTFLRTWGTQGSGPGQFSYPLGLSIDAGGNVYVVDQGNHRIQRFTTNGVFVSEWGSEGFDPGQFAFPSAATVTNDGDIIVSDTNNDRVQAFRTRETSEHRHFLSFGSAGFDNGQFQTVHGIAVDPDGYVYVVDQLLHRVQKFTWFGAWMATWGTEGSGNGQFNRPEGVAVNSSNDVFVADVNNARVQRFTAAGAYVLHWGTGGNGNGQFNQLTDIAIDPSDNIYVLDANGVQIFNNIGGYFGRWSVSLGQGIGIDVEGFVYVTTGDHVVNKYKPDGTFVTSWGSVGSNPGQFLYPMDVVGDLNGYVYVVDYFGGRIQKFTSDGVYLNESAGAGTALGQLDGPWTMAIDPAGNLFVGETSGLRVQKFNSPPELISVEDVTDDNGGQVVLRFRPSSAEALNSGSGISTYDFHFNTGIIWQYAGSVGADGYSHAAGIGTPFDGTVSTTGMVEYRVWTVLPVPNTVPTWGTLYGYSLDNIPPLSVPGDGPVTELALDPIRPNPVRARNLIARFALPVDSDAEVELLDLAGRRIDAQRVAGAGRKEVALARGRILAPGVYLVRVAQAGVQRTRRAVVVDGR